jgi:hypothetical protein
MDSLNLLGFISHEKEIFIDGRRNNAGTGRTMT